MKHAATIVIASCLLAACESQPIAWKKSDASEAMAKEDSAVCHAQARVAPAARPAPPTSLYTASMAFSGDDERLRFEQDQFRSCMQEKGYRQGR